MGITKSQGTKEIDKIFEMDLSKYDDSMMRAYTITYKLAW